MSNASWQQTNCWKRCTSKQRKQQWQVNQCESIVCVSIGMALRVSLGRVLFGAGAHGLSNARTPFKSYSLSMELGVSQELRSCFLRQWIEEHLLRLFGSEARYL
eukprot:5753346-Amphidinium_carterae.1